ncbi:MAG: FeoA family protein [Verrucomicrobiota bacterium]|jgi:Fe2+ transport system protein FeoA|nr:FeoA family protein [Verrucomicrobiota bacterium]
MDNTKSISQLHPGESAALGGMSLPMVAQERLQEMGLLPGEPVRLVRRAPLGCPIEFEVCGSRLAIRGRDAAQIFVQ